MTLVMEVVLDKLFEGEIPLEDFIQRLIDNSNKEKHQENAEEVDVKIAEFVPFFLNYLREKTSHHLASRHNVTTPKKSKPDTRKYDINQTTPTSNERESASYKHSSRGINFHSQKTPSPTTANSSVQRRFHHGEGQSSPSMRRKSPRVTQTPSPLVTQPKPNLDDMNDFPTIGAMSTPKSSGKKTPSRRITPTPVKDNRKSPSPFTNSPFASSSPIGDAGLSPVSLQEERIMLKAMRSKRRTKGDNRASLSPHARPVLGDFITSSSLEQSSTKDSGVCGNHKQFSKLPKRTDEIQPCFDVNSRANTLDSNSDKENIEQNDGKNNAEITTTNIVVLNQVEFPDKVSILSRLHATLIQECFVPNITSEVYFVAQLLNCKAATPEAEKNSEMQTKDNFLYSIHNTVYFAVILLENIKKIICLMDKGSLRLLAQNQRIADLSPMFKQWLEEKYANHSIPKVLDTSITSPVGGVPFSADRDNRKNFPTDKAFQNFRKQRDVFYELVREWEDCHNKPGWMMEESMGNRIRSLVHQRPDLANHSSFARLFQSQLLQMCKGEGSSTNGNTLLANWSKSNPDKFQRLYNRFLTPLSYGGPCPPPSFTEVQQFFKGFITSAESHSFSRHLMDHLIMKVTELDNTEFHLTEGKQDPSGEKSIQLQELQLSFGMCLSSLRILAKFLGYLVFQPYCGMTNQSNQSQMEKVVMLRNKVPQPFDVIQYINSAVRKGRVVLTVPWVVEYLSMMDPVAPYVNYYNTVLTLLVQIYRSSRIRLGGITHSTLLIGTCLGWLFETPVIPESLFFKSFEDHSIMEDNILSSSSIYLDSCDIVNQEMVYSCCPYLGEIKSALSETSSGMSSRTGQVKKITPVSTDHQPAKLSSNSKRLLEQLEENFYRIQPEFFKRTSDFTTERLCSNILYQIKTSIVPIALKTGAQEIETYLDSIGYPTEGDSDQAKEKSRPKVLQLIHSVTSDAVKKALEIIESSDELSLKSFQVLCPGDTNPKVICTAAKLTARRVKQKSTDWIHLSLAGIVEKDLFNHFDKFTNTLLHAKAKERRLKEAFKQANENKVDNSSRD